MLKLKEKFNVSLSRFHINRIINDNNITLKITRIIHELVKRFGKDIDINKKLDEFYEEIKQYKLEDIICIYETSIGSLQKRKHCYNKLGKRCIIKTSSQEVFKRYTGIFSILQKLEGLKYEELKKNIEKVVREIPKEKYKNIIRGTYK